MRMTMKSRPRLLFLSFLIIANSCISQTRILSTVDNIVYKEIMNPLTINLTEQACKNIIFKTANGVIEKQGCNVTYTPKQLGVAVIEIFSIVKGKKSKMGESIFRVRPLSNPYAHFAGKSGGTISKEVARVSNGLICYIPELTCQPTIVVDRYSVIVVKNKE